MSFFDHRWGNLPCISKYRGMGCGFAREVPDGTVRYEQPIKLPY